MKKKPTDNYFIQLDPTVMIYWILCNSFKIKQYNTWEHNNISQYTLGGYSCILSLVFKNITVRKQINKICAKYYKIVRKKVTQITRIEQMKDISW